MPEFGQILVIRGGAIGDFILTLPVFSALRERFRKSRLEVLGYPGIAQLARAGGLADGLHAIEAPALAGLFVRDGSWSDQTAGFFSRFDLIVSYVYDPESVFQNNVARCSRALFIAGAHRPDERGSCHAVDVFLQSLSALGICNPDPQPRLTFRAPVDSGPAGNRAIAMHPGSGSERKNWSPANWAALMNVLVEKTSWHFLLIGGEAEGDRLSQLARLAPPERLRLADRLPLIEAARELARCAAFIGHDSGISHLAAALGLPGLVLWGETNEQVWRPRSPKVQIVHGSCGLQSIEVATVLQLFLRLADRDVGVPRSQAT